MNNYTFSLDNKRPIKLFKCPSCGKREFKLYRNNDTGEYLSNDVGKCNRIVKCNYHYLPKEYFQNNQVVPIKPILYRKSHEEISQKVDFIPYSLFEKSLNHSNCFTSYLSSLFGNSFDFSKANR